MKLTKYIREGFIASAMNDVPSIDYDEMLQKRATELAIATMPPAVAEVYRTCPEWIVRSNSLAGSRRVYAPLPDGVCLPKEAQEELELICDMRMAQFEARRALRAKLTAAANSVTTRKALAELLPEFEKYLPKDDRTAVLNLPAVANIVSDFVQAGWPKGRVAA